MSLLRKRTTVVLVLFSCGLPLVVLHGVQIQDSERLKLVLLVVREIGNKLNEGTRAGAPRLMFMLQCSSQYKQEFLPE